jgi:hypothetical protein
VSKVGSERIIYATNTWASEVQTRLSAEEIQRSTVFRAVADMIGEHMRAGHGSVGGSGKTKRPAPGSGGDQDN